MYGVRLGRPVLPIGRVERDAVIELRDRRRHLLAQPDRQRLIDQRAHGRDRRAPAPRSGRPGRCIRRSASVTARSVLADRAEYPLVIERKGLERVVHRGAVAPEPPGGLAEIDLVAKARAIVGGHLEAGAAQLLGDHRRDRVQRDRVVEVAAHLFAAQGPDAAGILHRAGLRHQRIGRLDVVVEDAELLHGGVHGRRNRAPGGGSAGNGTPEISAAP